MESFEEKVVFGAGCVLAAAAVLCLVPFTRRRIAEAAGPMLSRIGEADAGEVATAAGKAAAQAAAAEGGKRFAGL